MATEIVMPALGIAQETGRVVQWLAAEGETVTAGQRYDLHFHTRLLIRRFGVRIPGGPPPKPQVDGLSGNVAARLASAPPVYLPSRTPQHRGEAACSSLIDNNRPTGGQQSPGSVGRIKSR